MTIHPFDRFDELYIPEPNSGCWLWLGHINNKGYGKFQLKRGGYSLVYAHRFSYEVYNCVEVPPHLHVCHSCDIPCCVNPDHLWAGTRSDNMQDCVAKGRFRKLGNPGSKNGRAILKEDQIMAIRNDVRSLRKIGREYGLDYTVISKIKAGKLWRHI
jgi:hypothetical protein